jgi:hypothetical protein
VFEIGSSLREARLRQRLELSEIERATRIRSRYLQALEDERFDLLPGTAYAKGFLRTYAEQLGLDGQRFVEEFDTRFPVVDEPPAVALTKVRRPRTLLDARIAIVAFAVLIGLIGWRVADIGGHHAAQRPPPFVSHIRLSHQGVHRASRAPGPKRTASLVLVARGPCWISVRQSSDAGRLLYEGTLERGQLVRFAVRRLWIRIGAPWNLEATLNSKHARLPDSIGNVIATPKGLRIG